MSINPTTNRAKAMLINLLASFAAGFCSKLTISPLGFNCNHSRILLGFAPLLIGVNLSALIRVYLEGRVRISSKSNLTSRRTRCAIPYPQSHANLTLPQHLPHCPPLGQLIHQLVEIPDLAHQRLLDCLDPHAADRAGDRSAGRVQRRGAGEELFESGARTTALPLDGGGISQLESEAN